MFHYFFFFSQFFSFLNFRQYFIHFLFVFQIHCCVNLKIHLNLLHAFWLPKMLDRKSFIYLFSFIIIVITLIYVLNKFYFSTNQTSLCIFCFFFANFLIMFFFFFRLYCVCCRTGGANALRSEILALYDNLLTEDKMIELIGRVLLRKRVFFGKCFFFFLFCFENENNSNVCKKIIFFVMCV